jgi:hypothetical protein
MTLPPHVAGEAGQSTRGADGAGPTVRGEPGGRLGRSQIVDEIPDPAAKQRVATTYRVDCHHVPAVLLETGAIGQQACSDATAGSRALVPQ